MPTMSEVFGARAAELCAGSELLQPETDLSALRPSGSWPAARSELVDALMEFRAEPLGRLMPGLMSGDLIDPARLKSRTVNILTARRIMTWPEVARLSANELVRIPGAGTGMLVDLLHAAVEVVTDPSAYPGWLDLAARHHSPGVLSLPLEVVHALRQLCSWAVQERSATKLSDVLSPAGAGMPDDVWQAVGELPIGPLAYPDLVLSDLGALLDAFLDRLKPSARLVCRRRLLTAAPVTFATIGAELGVTESMACFLQRDVEESLEAALAEDRFRPLAWRAAALRHELGTAAPAGQEWAQAAVARAVRGTDDSRAEGLRAFLLHLAGPYRQHDGWLRLDAAGTGPDPAELERLAGPDRLIPEEVVEEWLSGHGVRVEAHDDWLDWTGRFRRLPGAVTVWRGDIADRCLVVLAFDGVPRSTEALVELAGEGCSYDGLRRALIADARFKRSSPTAWALSGWPGEEYTTIADAIARRLDERGTVLKVADLARELQESFGVSEESVRTAAHAPIFVVESGLVRRRSPDEPYDEPESQDLSSCRGVFAAAPDRVGLLLAVTAGLLDGYGRAIPRPLAARLGASPGSPAQFDSPAGPLQIRWPVAVMGGPRLGSMRQILRRLEAKPGDLVRFEFSVAARALHMDLLASGWEHRLSAREALFRLTGVQPGRGADQHALAAAVGVPVGDLAERLRRRGDTAVANQLDRLAPGRPVSG